MCKSSRKDSNCGSLRELASKLLWNFDSVTTTSPDSTILKISRRSSKILGAQKTLRFDPKVDSYIRDITALDPLIPNTPTTVRASNNNTTAKAYLLNRTWTSAKQLVLLPALSTNGFLGAFCVRLANDISDWTLVMMILQHDIPALQRGK